MKTTSLVTAFVLISSFCLLAQGFSSVGDWDDDMPAALKLELLEKADPRDDVDEALKAKDYRCAGIVLGGLRGEFKIPGETAEMQCQAHGAKYIVHIGGDVIDDEWYESKKLEAPARKYAVEYNVYLLNRMKEQRV